MDLKTKQIASVLLALAGATGTIVTAYMVRKAAMKEKELYLELKPSGLNPEGFKDKLRSVGPIYIPSMIVGGVTIASILGSTIMSRRAQASIMSMAVMADQGWRKYKHQIKSKLGFDTHRDILSGIAKDKSKKKDLKMSEGDTRELYYEEHIGFFKANPEDVAFAYASINEYLNTASGDDPSPAHDFVTLAKFVELAGAEIIVDRAPMEELESIGWTMDYLVRNFDYAWVHIGLDVSSSDDGVYPINVISWIEDPIILDREDLYDDSLSLEGISVEETWAFDTKKPGGK